MRLFIFLSLALCVAALPAPYQQRRYDGYKVISAKPLSNEGVLYLNKLHGDIELDFWREARDDEAALIMLPPHRFTKVMIGLLRANVKVGIVNNNVQEKVDEEQRRMIAQPFAFDLNNFNSYEEIIGFLDGLQCASGLTCTNERIGTTNEGRELRLLKMSSGPGRQIIWIDSSIHAREWISPATNLKIINFLATSYGDDTDATSLLNSYDFYFVAMMNPDGYTYSRDFERYWRKNRGTNEGSNCVGTDLNRNFDTGRWASDGTSSDPCSDIFGGPSAGSEVETQAVQTYLKGIGSNTLALISMHSFAYAWIHPFGHTDGFDCEVPENFNKLNAAANAAADAARAVGGGNWRAGTVCSTINYAASGGAMDYAMAKAGISYSFTPELRGTDFVIDASEIEPSFKETWAAIKAAINSINSSV